VRVTDHESTAIVSPSASAETEHDSTNHTGAGMRTTTFQISLPGVAPRPYADSFSTSGTVSNTSRMTAEMKG